MSCEKFENQLRRQIPLSELKRISELVEPSESDVAPDLNSDDFLPVASPKVPKIVLDEVFSDQAIFENSEIMSTIESNDFMYLESDDEDNDTSDRATEFLKFRELKFDKNLKNQDSHFFANTLDKEMDTFCAQDLVEKIRPHLLEKKVLLLGPIDLAEIARVSEKRNISTLLKKNHSIDEIRRLLTVYANSSESFTRIDTVLFSNTSMAIKNSLVHEATQKSSHFVYVSMDLKTGVLKVFDTLGLNSISESAFLSEKALKAVYKSILISQTNHRTIKLSYIGTNFTQQGKTCGYLSVFNSIVALKYGIESVELYKFAHFRSSFLKMKELLAFIDITNTLPLDYIELDDDRMSE